MSEQTGWIVQSVAGHDRGDVLCVLSVEQGGQRLRLVDGKRRKLSKPKTKKLCHVRILDRGSFEHPTIRTLQNSQTVSNRGLRSALAAFKGGNHAWQKMI